MRSIVTVAALTALIALVPAAAQAATECKPVMVGAAVGTDSTAWQVWKQAVTNQYGAAWADLGLARNKTTSQINVVLAVEYFVSAEPCRVTRVNSALLNNIGDLQVMQSNDAGPSPAMTHKGTKLVKFN